MKKLFFLFILLYQANLFSIDAQTPSYLTLSDLFIFHKPGCWGMIDGKRCMGECQNIKMEELLDHFNDKEAAKETRVTYEKGLPVKDESTAGKKTLNKKNVAKNLPIIGSGLLFVGLSLKIISNVFKK